MSSAAVDMPDPSEPIQLRRSEAPRVQLGEISASGMKGHCGISVDDGVGWLRNDLLAGIIHSAPKGAAYRLDLAITQLDPGITGGISCTVDPGLRGVPDVPR
jgi:hypothetical protein